MNPQEFKARFLESLPELPPDLPELRRRFSEFVQFPATLVHSLKINQSDKSILSESGLPKDASPFLTFGLSPDRMLQPLNKALGLADSYSRYRMIGHNGSGDMICIDQRSDGSVVYLNHDNNMQVTFINSNVTMLAECLCIFAAFMRSKDANGCRDQIRRVDPPAMNSGTFWPPEIEEFERDE